MWTTKPNASHHWITVKTGDRKGAETAATIKLRLYDDLDKAKANASPIITLHEDRIDGSRSFDKGCINTRQAPVLDHMGPIAQIEVWREPVNSEVEAVHPKNVHQRNKADWFCELIVVKDTRDMKDYYFPVHRWLEPGEANKCSIPLYDTYLPRDDPNPEQREKQLKGKKDEYNYDREGSLPVQVRELPEDEIFSEYYATKTGLGDLISANKDPQYLKVTPTFPKWKSLQELKDVLYTTDEANAQNSGRQEGQQYYNYPIPKTLAQSSMCHDEKFGAQRLVGPNPTMIERCLKGIPEKLNVNVESLNRVLDAVDPLHAPAKWTVVEAIKANRLYFTDYKILDGIKTVDGRQFVAPIALWFQNSENLLLPVAIQLQQHAKDEKDVFLPKFDETTKRDNSNTWQLAKMWLNLADATVHQTVSHLGFTHLLMEGVCIATHRNLASNHPIFRLLAPHFLYLLNINALGRDLLMGPVDKDTKERNSGFFDAGMAIGVKGFIELVERRLKEWRLDVHGSLKDELRSRNVGKTSELAHYPYRDDGVLVYEAIEAYVERIVNHYYAVDDSHHEKLKNDTEIQKWGAELAKSAEDGGVGIKGIPDQGEFQSPASLIKTLTSLIFTCSAQHAVVNFSQYEEYAFPPNYPAFLYGDPHKDTRKDSAHTEPDLLQYLPDQFRSALVLRVATILSQNETKKLGDWEFKYQYDPPAQEAEKRFREDLTMVSQKIKHNNVNRPSVYRNHDLDPHRIPNAISI